MEVTYKFLWVIAQNIFRTFSFIKCIRQQEKRAKKNFKTLITKKIHNIVYMGLNRSDVPLVHNIEYGPVIFIHNYAIVFVRVRLCINTCIQCTKCSDKLIYCIQLCRQSHKMMSDKKHFIIYQRRYNKQGNISTIILFIQVIS